MPNLGMGELVVILLVVLLVFGASRLPQIGEGFGKAIRNFKRGVQGEDEIKVTPKKPQIGASSGAQSLESHAPTDAEIVDRKE